MPAGFPNEEVSIQWPVHSQLIDLALCGDAKLAVLKKTDASVMIQICSLQSHMAAHKHQVHFLKTVHFVAK